MLAAPGIHPTPQGPPHLALPRRVLHDGERRGVGRAVSHQRGTKHAGQVEHVHLAVGAARHPVRGEGRREHAARAKGPLILSPASPLWATEPGRGAESQEMGTDPREPVPG